MQSLDERRQQPPWLAAYCEEEWDLTSAGCDEFPEVLMIQMGSGFFLLTKHFRGGGCCSIYVLPWYQLCTVLQGGHGSCSRIPWKAAWAPWKVAAESWKEGAPSVPGSLEVCYDFKRKNRGRKCWKIGLLLKHLQLLWCEKNLKAKRRELNTACGPEHGGWFLLARSLLPQNGLWQPLVGFHPHLGCDGWVLSSSIESLRHQLEDALRGGGAPCALISWAPLHHFSSSFSLQIQLVQFKSPQEEGEASGVAGTPPYLQTNSSLCFQSAEAFLIDVAELFMGYKLADGHCLFVTVYHALFFFFFPPCGTFTA